MITRFSSAAWRCTSHLKVTRVTENLHRSTKFFGQKALNTGLNLLSVLRMEIGLLYCCEMQLYFRFLRASEALLSFPGVNVIWRDETRGDGRIVSNGIHFIEPRGRSCFVSAAAQETEVKRLEPRVKTHIGYFFFFSSFRQEASPILLTKPDCFHANARAATRLRMSLWHSSKKMCHRQRGAE